MQPITLAVVSEQNPPASGRDWHLLHTSFENLQLALFSVAAASTIVFSLSLFAEAWPVVVVSAAIAGVAGVVGAARDFRGFAPVIAVAGAAPDADPVFVSLEKGFEIDVRPKGARGPFSARVLDRRDRVLFDDQAFRSQHFGSLTLRLSRGEYVLELSCPGFETMRVPLAVREDMVVMPVVTATGEPEDR